MSIEFVGDGPKNFYDEEFQDLVEYANHQEVEEEKDLDVDNYLGEERFCDIPQDYWDD